MEEAERRLAELEARNAREEEEDRKPAPQVPIFDEGAEWAPLPESSNEAEQSWPSGAEWAPLRKAVCPMKSGHL